jgi:hypothetical protein
MSASPSETVDRVIENFNGGLPTSRDLVPSIIFTVAVSNSSHGAGRPSNNLSALTESLSTFSARIDPAHVDLSPVFSETPIQNPGERSHVLHPAHRRDDHESVHVSSRIQRVYPE